MATNFGELWPTKGENGTFSTHSRSTFSDAHMSGDKRRCTIKISQLLANAYLIGDGSVTNNFLRIKFENWPKIWCWCLYCRDLLGGNCTKLSYLMCPHRGIKCPYVILEVLLRKILWRKNVVFNYSILRLYCK